MTKSARIAALLAGFAVVALIQGVAAQTPTRPPTNLKFVDGHWTAWDPPVAGADAYRIVKGDTLWALSQRWLGDPFLWPQIWDENRYILDSHWIYPGDPLTIPGRPLVVPEGGPPEDEIPTEASGGYGRGLEETPPPVRRDPERPKMLPVAGFSDVYCSGFIEPEVPEATLTVLGTEGMDEKLAMSEGDIIYLDRGSDWGLQPGDEFVAVRPQSIVVHPVTKQALGTHVQRLGKVRVMLVHETNSTAIVSMSCRDITVGDTLRPWVEIPIPLQGPAEYDRHDVTPSGGAQGHIVWGGGETTLMENSEVKQTIMATGHMMQTDLGLASGVRPGDVLSLFEERESLPRRNLGQAVILTVEPGTSTAMVTLSVLEVEIGDRVEVAR